MNEYFQAGSVPPYNGIGSSAQMRAEFASIAAAFDKLPVMAGSADDFVLVNSTGTALVASNYKFTDFATVVGEQTLINKTIVWADNKIGTIPVAGGGTGAINVPEAQKNLGIDLKADSRNAVLTGAPTCPTPPLSDRGGRIANTQFVADTVKAIGAAVPSDNLPLMDGGVAVAGVSNFVSRDDHIHEHDSSRAVAAAETAGGTSFVSTSTIASKDVQAAISELDTKKAPLISPVFTGSPKAPSPKTDSNDTSVATTAYTKALIAQQPIGVQLSDDLPLHDEAAPSAGIGVDGSRYDHVHGTDPSRAPIADPTFTGTVGGISKAMVGLPLVDNTADLKKPVSEATTAALDKRVSKTSDTGMAFIPGGPTSARDPAPKFVGIRYNTTLSAWEGWNMADWSSIGGGQMLGKALVKAVSFNSQVIDEAIVVLAGVSAFSAGPISFGLSGSISFEPGTCWKFI